MDSEYHRMRSLPERTGSLNAVVSEARRHRRPLSLSESFAHSPLNVERALSTRDISCTSLTLLVEERPSPQQDAFASVLVDTGAVDTGAVDTGAVETAAVETATTPPPESSWSESTVVNVTLRFLFHITLISIFETVFFFIYVSTLEDSGILRTIHTLTDGFVHSCSNLTTLEQDIADDLLSPFINVTEINTQANTVYTARVRYNTSLFRNAWLYVGALSIAFLSLTGYSCYRKIRVAWRPLLIENIGLVTLLAVYEYMFFTTIIFPYSAISGQEIEQQLVSELQGQCGLLLNQTT